MTRLGRSERGNMIAIGAAALIPLAGLIGGGVDMSRLYLAKTRLQQACDAGALAGRKAMAAGSWTTGTGDTSEARAKEFFNANFVDGAYGTRARSFTFVEVEGEVIGTAYVTVPMTMMRIFNMPDREMEVKCTAKMEIPNTDVMFVLDATYSMQGSKMTGLKSAVKCFYEALLRVNTPEVCTTDNTDPTATAYTGTAQIRLGFVPYGVNVNVGRLLLHDWMPDSWTYQSRIANRRTVYGWTAGNASGGSNFGAWAPESALGTAFTRTSGYGSFTDVPAATTSITTADGVSRPRINTAGNSTARCTALNSFGGRTELVGIAETYGSESPITYSDTNSAAPVHPATSQTVEAIKTRQATVTTGYRYNPVTSNRTTTCVLQQATKSGTTRSYTQRSVGTGTRPITWQEYQEFSNYTYGPRAIDISALKGTDDTWTSSITLPDATTVSGPTITVSGRKSATTLAVPSSMVVGWTGCIEERLTFTTSNTDPSGDWTPIPATALDMNIDMVPDDNVAGSHWAPLLVDATWGRYTGRNRTFNPLDSSEDLDRNFNTGNCHVNNVARKLREYRTAAEVTNFSNYISNLVANDYGTYHDSGMLWGARLISPSGIFQNENQATPTGGNIQRHIIFMTDGNAQAFTENYGLHGIPFYDRRQTSYNPTPEQLQALTNARLLALCAEIKRRNIKLWVISYGGGVDVDNEARLTTCASSGHFYSAADGPALRARFQQIAAEIAELRLTK